MGFLGVKSAVGIARASIDQAASDRMYTYVSEHVLSSVRYMLASNKLTVGYQSFDLTAKGLKLSEAQFRNNAAGYIAQLRQVYGNDAISSEYFNGTELRISIRISREAMERP